MMRQIVIDNTTYKIMKYLYGKHDVSFGKIESKFGEDNAQLVHELIRGNYAAHRLPSGELSQDSSNLGYNSKISLLVPGNKYIEDRRSSNMIRITPILVSIVSAIVSVIGLIISIFSSNAEIFVHLLE